MAVLGGTVLLLAMGSVVGAFQESGDAPEGTSPSTEVAIAQSQKPSEETVTARKSLGPK